jgi:prophage antirepressor-like protein
MNGITTFENLEFGAIRTKIIKDEPYFCLPDVCGALEIKNISQLKTRLNKDGVIISEVIDSVGRRQNANFVNELNLYKVIFQSRKESAERFTDWVAGEVLPSIRKTGSYQKQLSPQEMMRIQLGMIDDHEDRIKSLESNMVIDYGQQQTLRQHVNKAVLNALGGKDTEAYAYISKVVFAECNRDLQDRFKVNSRNNILRKRYEEAIDYVDNWEPKTNTKLRIDEYNRQQRFEV